MCVHKRDFSLLDGVRRPGVLRKNEITQDFLDIVNEDKLQATAVSGYISQVLTWQDNTSYAGALCSRKLFRDTFDTKNAPLVIPNIDIAGECGVRIKLPFPTAAVHCNCRTEGDGTAGIRCISMISAKDNILVGAEPASSLKRSACPDNCRQKGSLRRDNCIDFS